MYIQEAVKESLASGKWIQRKSWLTCFAGKIAILPTNTYDCCIVGRLNIETGFVENQEKYWNPKAEDLVADDWEVVDGWNQKIVCNDDVIKALDDAIEKSISNLINAKKGQRLGLLLLSLKSLCLQGQNFLQG